MDSNMTDTSVEEPKYARVTHKKRNSKICSGNSTPKVKRRELSGSKISRSVNNIIRSIFPFPGETLQSRENPTIL